MNYGQITKNYTVLKDTEIDNSYNNIMSVTVFNQGETTVFVNGFELRPNLTEPLYGDTAVIYKSDTMPSLDDDYEVKFEGSINNKLFISVSRYKTLKKCPK